MNKKEDIVRVVISDLHLGSAHSKEKELLSFLVALQKKVGLVKYIW